VQQDANHTRPSPADSIRFFLRQTVKQRYLILMTIPAFMVVLVFNYFPMYGIVIAFQDFSVMKGTIASPWVGLKWFEYFFQNPMAMRLVRNTALLGVYSLVWGFPAPIILALLINEIKHKIPRRLVQSISYLPYFVSTVIIVGMLKQIASLDGVVNDLVVFLGMKPIQFFARPEWFRTLFVSSGIWQYVGWSTIIYLAAITSVDIQLYEAAVIDGANRWHRLVHITFPSIIPTILILFILNVGSILGTDYIKVMLMYNPQTFETADVIGTYVYREGIQGARFSYSTAVGLMMSLISFALVFTTNLLSRKVTQVSLW
jgi:putative aldouronate transport system permease protein